MAELDTGGIAAEHGLTELAAGSPLAAPEAADEDQTEDNPNADKEA